MPDGFDSIPDYCATATGQLARMGELGDNVQSRFVQFDLSRWPPDTALGVNPEAYPEHYVNGTLTNSEFPAHCQKFGIEPAALPRNAFKAAATQTIASVGRNLTNKNGYTA